MEDRKAHHSIKHGDSTSRSVYPTTKRSNQRCLSENQRSGIPVDFVIVDIEEDADIPIILGRP
ncbi:hypothetical protein A2U01_0103807, partial [Trifolium medium]|nr:hypothetical protein [Trifolium medium]